MLKSNLILLSLTILFLNITMAVSQDAVKPLKQLQPHYEKIIHFDKEDYHLRGINPDDYKGYEGYPINGVQGLYAGDKYLTVWDNENVFVFDLTTYTKLATLSPPLSIDDIVEKDGVIYCLYNGGRTDTRIYVYDSFDSYKEYIFLSQFKNLAEYKTFRKEFTLDQKEGQKRIRKRKPPSLTDRRSLRGMRIRTLDVSEGKIYANIEQNFLNIEQDFNIENEDGKFYMFTKQDIQKKERKWLPFLFNGTILSCSRKKLEDDSVKIEFIFDDLEDNFLKKEEIVLESNEQIGKIASSTPLALLGDRIIIRYLRDYLNKDYCGAFILIANLNTKEKQIIELPNPPRNLGIMTNYFQYASFSNSSAFLISYNSDLSFDILKVEVK